MKSSRFIAAISGITFIVLACSTALSVHADTITWDGSDSTAWALGNNWTGDIAPANSLFTDIARFDSASYSNQPDAGTTSIKGIQVGAGSGALTLGGSSLSLGSAGINVAAGAGSVTINSPLVIGAAQTWANNSSNTLSLAGSVTRSSGATLSISGTGAIATTMSNDASGILGGWATANGTADWAAVSGGNIVTYAGYTNVTGNQTGAGASSQNWKTTGNVTLTASATVNSLNLQNDFTLNSGVALTVGSGGIILGSSERWFLGTGGTIRSGLASGELFIHANTPTFSNGFQIQPVVIDGSAATKVVKGGSGQVEMGNGNNTFSGGFVLNAGSVYLGSSSTGSGNSVTKGPLGTGLVTLNGGTLVLGGKANGNWQNNPNGYTLGNNISVPAGASAVIDSIGGNGGLNGNVSGSGSLTIQNSSGTNLSVMAGGDWSGFSGTLHYNASAGLGRIVNFFAPANIDLSNAAVTFSNTGNNVNSSFRTSGTSKIGSLSGSGYLDVAGTMEIGDLDTTTTFSGVIRDNGSAGAVTKIGDGTLTLNGVNTYTGKTTVSGGSLALGLNGSIANTSEVALNGGTLDVSAKGSGGYTVNNLTGSGTVTGTLTVSTQLAIGNSPGTIEFDNLTLGSSSTYVFDLVGGDTGADLAQVSGNLGISSGALLDLVQLGSYTEGDKFTLFAYQTGNLTGTFSGLADGAEFTDAGGLWKINYFDTTPGLNGGLGTSFVTIVAVPEPAAALLGGIGLLTLLRRRRN